MKKLKTLHDKAVAAMNEAVREVVQRHKKTGRPLAIWEHGKVKRVAAE